MVQPQLVKIGGPWARSMIGAPGPWKKVHRPGPYFNMTRSMDPVHGGGPCFVLSPNRTLNEDWDFDKVTVQVRSLATRRQNFKFIELWIFSKDWLSSVFTAFAELPSCGKRRFVASRSGRLFFNWRLEALEVSLGTFLQKELWNLPNVRHL